MLAFGAIVVVIILIAALWVFTSHPSGASTTVYPVTTIPSTPGITGTSQPPAHPAPTITVQDLLTGIAAYNTPSSFTAEYVGTISSTTPSASLTFTGNVVSKYERYNGSALSSTSEWSNQSLKFNTTSEYFFSSNGPSYYCFSNTTANYGCHTIEIPFNITTFGLSTFLATMPSSGFGTPLTVSNSSYDGRPCLALSANISNSTSSSGVTVNTTVRVSSCIETTYKIPLVLNISATDSESGVYTNGTTRVAVPPETAKIAVGLHIVNLTNSSSELQVTTLPANAVMLG
jgi:hypothetical protein